MYVIRFCCFKLHLSVFSRKFFEFLFYIYCYKWTAIKRDSVKASETQDNWQFVNDPWAKWILYCAASWRRRWELCFNIFPWICLTYNFAVPVYDARNKPMNFDTLPPYKDLERLEREELLANDLVATCFTISKYYSREKEADFISLNLQWIVLLDRPNNS